MRLADRAVSNVGPPRRRQGYFRKARLPIITSEVFEILSLLQPGLICPEEFVAESVLCISDRSVPSFLLNSLHCFQSRNHGRDEVALQNQAKAAIVLVDLVVNSG
jgi:hypothetical protein